jgi:hypothetical protein
MDAEMLANAGPAPLMTEQEANHDMGASAMITTATATPSMGKDTLETAPK